MKKAIYMILCFCIFCGISAKAESIYPTDVKKPSKNCVMAGVKGSYISDARKALDRMNEIRKEACKEGVRHPGAKRKLTMEDYVPLKWSGDLEYIARIRAAESALMVSHVRPNGESCFSLKSPNGIQSYGEVLAWNYSKSMLHAIGQWYDEKSIWVRGGSGVTGHYTQMIDPKNKYVGLGDFYLDSSQGAVWPNVTAGEFSAQKLSDHRFSPEVQDCVQMVEVKVQSLKRQKISGKDRLTTGEQGNYRLLADVKDINEIRIEILDPEWTSSDPSVVSVDKKGTFISRSQGFSYIKADTGNGIRAELEVAVSDRGSAVRPGITPKPEERPEEKPEGKPESEESQEPEKVESQETEKTPDKVENQKPEKKPVPIGFGRRRGVLYTGGRLHTYRLVLRQGDRSIHPSHMSWSSSNPSVASVTQYGTVTGRRTGTAVITALYQGKRYSCQIIVEKPVFKLNRQEITMKRGRKKEIHYRATPGAEASYQSLNKKIASVTKKGIIKAKKKGKVKIKVTCNGMVRHLKVRIK